MKKIVLSFFTLVLAAFLLFTGAVYVKDGLSIPISEAPPAASPPPTSVPAEPAQPPPPGGTDVPAASLSVTVAEQQKEENIKADDGALLVKADISLPLVKEDTAAAEAINAYYENLLARHLDNARQGLYDMALSEYSRWGADFLSYSAEQLFFVQLNRGGYLSVMRVYSEYTGGAHGSELLYGDNFKLENGGLLRLADLFSADEDVYMEQIFTLVEEQIAAKNSEEYFADYASRLRRTFDSSNFFLSEQGLGIFYQLYSIAPYAAGAPVFYIPYAKLKDYMRGEVYDVLAD